MVNKKLVALFVAIFSASSSFGFLDDVFEGTGKVVKGTVDTATSAPRTVVTGETRRERQARRRAEDQGRYNNTRYNDNQERWAREDVVDYDDIRDNE